MTIVPFPLCWPEGFPRTAKRDVGRFKTTLAKALDNVRISLRQFGGDSGRPVSEVTITSNVSLGIGKPADAGVAAWFMWDGERRCIPVDRYDSVEANLQAIHHIIEARRTEIRHGTMALVRASFRGFTPALPAPDGASWRRALGLGSGEVTRAMIDKKYLELAKRRHPDHGGTDAEMAALNRARAAALEEVEAGA